MTTGTRNRIRDLRSIALGAIILALGACGMEEEAAAPTDQASEVAPAVEESQHALEADEALKPYTGLCEIDRNTRRETGYCIGSRFTAATDAEGASADLAVSQDLPATCSRRLSRNCLRGRPAVRPVLNPTCRVLTTNRNCR